MDESVPAESWGNYEETWTRVGIRIDNATDKGD
jgi:hypothetical protein